MDHIYYILVLMQLFLLHSMLQVKSYNDNFPIAMANCHYQKISQLPSTYYLRKGKQCQAAVEFEDNYVSLLRQVPKLVFSVLYFLPIILSFH